MAGAAHAQVTAGPTLVPGGLLATPFAPGDPDPAETAAAAALLTPGSPENDLLAALDAMAGAGTAADAADARQLAIDILEGNPIPRKAYSGIPLLNWNAPAKVKSGPTAEVRQVRFGEHALSDTWLLGPTAPTSIRYRVVEMGTAVGGQLNPTPLLGAGTGQHAAIQPLAIDNQDTGTHQDSRFTNHPERALGAVPEQTRSALQDVTVAVPAAATAILDPNLREGHEGGTALLPRTDARLAAARAALNFQDAIDPVTGPTAADKNRAIGRLAEQSPEKIIWTALANVGAADLAGMRAVGSGNRDLVAAMRSRTELPAGITRDAGADATIVLQNNETYLCRPSLQGACESRRPLRLGPGAGVRVQVVNRDGFSHRLTAFDLHNRTRGQGIHGAEDWGRFDWTERTLTGAGEPTVGPGESKTFTITPADDGFALWLGDLGSGDQANAFIELERGIRHEALEFGAGTTPIHAAPDPEGNMWVTLAGTDAIARVRPHEQLPLSGVDRFPVPNGRTAIDDPRPPQAPADITVDGRGIVWATLSSGNALLRINPALVQPGLPPGRAEYPGMTVIPLEACPTSIERCRPELPAVPNEQPTRRPTRIKSMIDGQGHTVLWFVEAGASGIGAMRVTQDGQKVNEAHFLCGCFAPESLDLGPDGSVWFTQIFENRIGRLRPDPTNPYSSSAVHIDQYDIPGAAEVADAAAPARPGVPAGVVFTSLPLSIAVDGRNRVWFSESAMGGVAWLDPDEARPQACTPDPETQPRTGSCDSPGFTEIEQPGSDFRSPSAPADVTVDRANNFWWAGEYGDQIEQVLPNAQKGLSFRGSVRRGLTEGPISDAQGNLWTVETGGNLITRLSGVTQGVLRPFGPPAAYRADIALDRVTGADLRDTDSVEVRVQRGSAVVASATVPVAGGSFDVSGADWGGAGDPIQPDDTVRIQPRGPFERAELSFRVANLTAAVQGDGSVAGFATVPDPDRPGQRKALADRVRIDLGSATLSAGIDGGSGAWRAGSGLAPSTGGDVSWSGATVAGTFTTVNRFGAGPVAPPPPAPPAPPAPAPARPPAGPPPEAARQPNARDRACEERHWLYGRSRTRPSVLLLRMTRTQVERCLGKPTRKHRATRTRPERWTYGRGLSITFRAGRVTGFTLNDGRFGTSRGGAGVGSSLTVLKRALPGVRNDRRARRQRAVVRLSDGRYADVRVRVAGGKVRQIVVSLKTRSRLDAFGRSLLRSRT